VQQFADERDETPSPSLDIVDEWIAESFPASDPPQSWDREPTTGGTGRAGRAGRK
jgi:hypothetical protein